MITDGRAKNLEGVRSPMWVIGLGIALLFVVTGCGKHYWSHAGSGPEDFIRDSDACARENFLYASGTKEYGIVLEDRYRACLKSRGWVRAQHLEPTPGWFRGVEDEVVRFDAPTPRPSSSQR